MIKLGAEETAGVYLSLWESSVNALENYYLLVFTNLQTRISEGIVVGKINDLTYTNERSVYLYFDVNKTGALNYTMQENSFFKYDVYEQTSSTNTDITDVSVLGLRETGKAWVNGTSEVVYVKQPEANKTNSVYLKV